MLNRVIDALPVTRQGAPIRQLADAGSSPATRAELEKLAKN
jgi:hypothetical protein